MVAGLVVLVFVTGCIEGPDTAPTDTGYVGTWSRGNERAQSIVSIVREGEDYRFRWKVISENGGWYVNCDWDGRCEEFAEDGVKISDLQFRPYVHPDTGHLMVEVTQQVHVDPPRDVHYIDELVVEPGGQSMWSYTVERNGETYEGEFRPKRKLDKISDSVAAPPRPAVAEPPS